MAIDAIEAQYLTEVGSAMAPLSHSVLQEVGAARAEGQDSISVIQRRAPDVAAAIAAAAARRAAALLKIRGNGA